MATDYTKADFWIDFGNTGDREVRQAFHRRYYGQFVTPAVIETVVRFNDIPLARWDRVGDIVNRMCGAHMAQCDGLGGGQYWTSNGVCVAKEAARMWREQQDAQAKGAT